MQPPYPPSGEPPHASQHPSGYPLAEGPPGPSHYPQVPHRHPSGHAPKASNAAGWIVGLLVVFFVAVPMLGILAVLAISGVHRYTTRAKQAEAINALHTSDGPDGVYGGLGRVQ